jgi:hypothetical protein
MSKLTKLIRDPRLFFADSIRKRANQMEQRLLPQRQSSVPKVPRYYHELPKWLQPQSTDHLDKENPDHFPYYLYLPWIAQHTDQLIESVRDDRYYKILPFDLYRDVEKNRKEIMRYARENPVAYRRLVLQRLIPLKHRVIGVIFTFDWSPVMRIISNVCEELGIKRILIPHESVFLDRSKYYLDINSRASVPAADMILGWGKLQKEIFIERGYPASRFKIMGAPKFDQYVNYQPLLSEKEFRLLFGFDLIKPIILFAAQPLDSQVDSEKARETQCQIIYDLIAYAEKNDKQLLVRMPPSQDDILTPVLRQAIIKSDVVSLDEAYCYVVPAVEAIYHACMVASINSTMLFEAVLMNRSAISIHYMPLHQLWQPLGLPVVHNKIDLWSSLDDYMIQRWKPDAEKMQWAADMFSIGTFDGRASERIRQYLKDFILLSDLECRLSAVERIFSLDDTGIDVIGVHSDDRVAQTSQRYLTALLGAQQRVSTRKGLAQPVTVATIDLLVQWGMTPTLSKSKQAQIGRELGRPTVIVEDGFIRSIGIGLSGEAGLSIIMDDTTAYYDAMSAPSRLERQINSNIEITDAQRTNALALIDKIVSLKVSKYNHAPQVILADCFPQLKNRQHRILLIDQRYHDQSVESGLANDQSFDQMVLDALHDYPESQILIKKHPDSIFGAKKSYLNFDRLQKLNAMHRIIPIMFDINPYSLFAQVDDIFVATSGMGFEALMAGHQVHCYGVPFYAGWGLTQDKQTLTRRHRSRRLEDIFHFAYIENSRYFHPELGQRVSLDTLIDYIIEKTTP